MTFDNWTFDNWMSVLSLLVGVIGILVAVVGIFDARRQRTKREKAVITAVSVVERTYGLLIGAKPAVALLGAEYVAAVNDGLETINQHRADLRKL